MEADIAIVASLGIAKPAVEMACELLKELLREPLKVSGVMLADRLYLLQWKSRIAILQQAQQIISQSSIAKRLLPSGFFLQFLREAGDIEDESLQQLWAQLLASAVEDDSAAHPGFVHTLKQLSPTDARLLRYMRHVFDSIHEKARDPLPLPTVASVASDLGLPIDITLFSSHNLMRLGILQEDQMWPLHNPDTSLEDTPDFSLTRFGVYFTEACTKTSSDPTKQS